MALVLYNHNNGEHCWLVNGPEDDHWHPPQRGKVTECHYWKRWLFTECCSKAKGQQSHFWNRNIIRSILPGLRRKITGLLLCGPKSPFQIIVHFAFNLEIKVWRLERHRIQAAWSPVWSFRSQWWFGLPWCLLVCWSIVFYQVQSQCSHLPGDFGALYASICWQALWRCWFPFPAGRSPAHRAKTASKLALVERTYYITSTQIYLKNIEWMVAWIVIF